MAGAAVQRGFSKGEVGPRALSALFSLSLNLTYLLTYLGGGGGGVVVKVTDS